VPEQITDDVDRGRARIVLSRPEKRYARSNRLLHELHVDGRFVDPEA
jgi:hypothetical protein